MVACSVAEGLLVTVQVILTVDFCDALVGGVVALWLLLQPTARRRAEIIKALHALT
jgi:hypothetical protein